MKISNISSKATKPIVTKFPTEPPGVEVKKICANHLGLILVIVIVLMST